MAPLSSEIERAIRAYRLKRVQSMLTSHDCAALVLFDPINLRYATGSRNMQVWTMHHACRYAFVPATGQATLFDYARCEHLSRHLESIREVRPALAWDFFSAGDRAQELADRWAAEIADLLRVCAGAGARIAIDRADIMPLESLKALGVEVIDGKPLMERARAIKSAEEIFAMRAAIVASEAGVAAMRLSVRPGMRESDALADLSRENIARGGEYMETRLLSSGPRTNPWFQETSDRVMQAGDLLTFDTDLIGPGGFFVDFSRAWVVGEGRLAPPQRTIYALAREQLEHNIALLKPGLSFRDYSARAWCIPEAYRQNRYAELVHGAGMGVEYPLVYHWQDWDGFGYDGAFEENMIVCVESYIGAVGGAEGVKLEQQVLIGQNGAIPLTGYPFEDA